ncbi:MAG TPA: hypothetical protein VK308_03475, partial [Pyrinomonadaceae bacterium]|nr:hypothetical protein [Pyrinomonadaceae bacterium]
MRTFITLVLTAMFCCTAVAGNAQSATEARQNVGAIDPLLDDYRFLRQGNSNQLKNNPANDSFVSQKANLPTAGELDASLNVNIDSYPGNVRTTAVQPDGKILVAGYFRTVNGIRHKSIVRLNADFSLDSTFSADVNGTILAVALQADGKIVIGGSFLSAGGANRNRIARLNTNGSLDTTFNPGTGADNLVYDVAVQADGKILLGGNFYTVNSANNYGIARLNADGSVDSSFVSPLPVPVPNPNPLLLTPGVVYSIAVQTDGKILIGGFIVLNYASSGIVMTPVTRLNTNGAFDSSFNQVSGNSSALKLALQPDGKILMAGNFTTLNGVNRNYIARLNADGTLDNSFNIGSGPNSQVFTIYIQPDGKILLAGFFASINGTTRNRIARLNSDGTLDDTFVPSGSFLTGTIQSVISLPNGKIVAGGSFSGGFNATNDSVKIFNPDGSDHTNFRFETAALGGVRAIAVQPDGKILVGGYFTRPRSGGVAQLFRLNVNGSLDETFAASPLGFSSSSNAQVNSILIQPDGKILIAGLNIGVSGNGGLSLITNLARLNADGTFDNSFTPGTIPAGRGINAIALQPDGKIVAVWSGSLSNGMPFGAVSRLNSD